MWWGVTGSVASTAFERLNWYNVKERNNTSFTTSLGELIYSRISLTIRGFFVFFCLIWLVCLFLNLGIRFISLLLVVTLRTTNAFPLSCLCILNYSRPLLIPPFLVAKAGRFINTVGKNPKSEILSLYNSRRFPNV